MKWYPTDRRPLAAFLLLLLSFGLPLRAACRPVVAAAPADTVRAEQDTVTLASAASDRYDRLVAHYRRGWSRLVPSHYVLQYAGSIGLLSAGVGWHYGRDHWETEMLLGFVPRYNSSSAKMTFTLRQRYIPWHVPIGRRWVIEPLTTGLFFSSIFSHHFWAHEPSRYPGSYYGFLTKIRANIFVGERVKFNIPQRHRYLVKSVSLYYELSTSDLYIVTAATNRRIRLGDILSLALGARFEVF